MFKSDETTVKRILRHFELNNDSKLEWRSNPQNIIDNVVSMYYFEPIAQYTGPAKVLVGGFANRWNIEHYIECFPKITEEDIITIPETSHWVHIDDPESVIKHIHDLLKQL